MDGTMSSLLTVDLGDKSKPRTTEFLFSTMTSIWETNTGNQMKEMQKRVQ